MKTGLLIIWLTIILGSIAFLFWHNEWKYSLPTPVPANYHPVSPGTTINVTGIPGSHQNKPLFLHFFNPDCPCSRFNITHFKTLVKQYGNAINFAVVVLTQNNNYTAAGIQQKYNLDIPVLFDTAIACKCGVYSTPQAAIIDKDQKLYYRGNYNKSRYCNDNKSNYALMAINALLSKTKYPVFGIAAITSYGCQLPGCSK